MSKHERRTINSFTYPLVFLLICQPVNPKQRQLFSKKFNTISALSAHQPPTLPQKKSILAKVCFEAKRGLSVNTIK